MKNQEFKYPKLEKTLGDFSLTIEPGKFSSSQITVMLGENGTGKTTFIRMLAGVDKNEKLLLREPVESFTGV